MDNKCRKIPTKTNFQLKYNLFYVQLTIAYEYRIKIKIKIINIKPKYKIVNIQ
jgi:hypothetical protein